MNDNMGGGFVPPEGQPQRYPKIATYLWREWIKYQIKERDRGSQTGFAALCGITQPAMSKLMSGNTFPKIHTIISIADALGPGFFDACNIPRLMPKKSKILVDIVEGFATLTKDEQKTIYEKYKELLQHHKAESPDQLFQDVT